jgi:integrase
MDPETTSVRDLTEPALGWLAAHLKRYSPATERLYLNAVVGFYSYLSAEDLAQVSMPRLRQLIKQRARRPGIRLPQFPVNDIETLLRYAAGPLKEQAKAPDSRLRASRDRAFLITLADTGLRVHEACRLRRGDIDWNEGRGVVVGKGNQQAVVRFSRRAIRALKAYLALRAAADGRSGRPLATLPLFARHDKGAGTRIQAVTTSTGRKIVAALASEALGDEAEGKITPHSLRHYFVTTVLRGSGNLKLAQELARHKNIQVTQRYAHLANDELDRGYHEIFEQD